MSESIGESRNQASHNMFDSRSSNQYGNSAGIEVRNVSYHYGKMQALDAVSLTLSNGINMLLGPNGAGKSTLFSLLTGLKTTPRHNVKGVRIKTSTKGAAPKPTCEISVRGVNLQNTRTDIMRSMGVVFQQSTLDLDLTVQQNLLYHASLHGISPKTALRNIEDVLLTLSLNEKLNAKVRRLNGGHRRRVELARALLHKPSVLLLDEPTVGLDIESRALIIKHVRTLTEREGLCVLWATHLMDEVISADNLIVLHAGQVKAQGISHKLCAHYQVGSVAELYRQLTANMEAL
ncbi:ATP-binding cassette domain-containing protein [Paraglaciecola chathamensis]|uniref:ATP-binding cassette domain-containing protein n=1 Tax=Paraglaciecola chathamensis TaxID=368405 RepID=A0ABS0WI87_9ALTE|nr:ABC transporter ATP-binding protein [Paraglaciecola chathamensis]MBJ2138173.1 ATP-binding cassette domain-containing protein [Paraglaciecola chathamensis]